METNFNLGSLKIVHTPLMDYFKKVQSNVSENLTLIREEKKVATNYEAIDHLRKIQSSLKMIGLQGIVKVLSLVQESLKEIKEVKYETQKSIQILEVSQLILQEIEYYIQNLLAGELDQPTQLFTNYKNLAELINKPVSIKDLFVPKLEIHNSVFQEELKVGYFINETSKNNLFSTLTPNAEALEQSIHTLINGVEKEGIFASVDEKNDYQTACRHAYEALNAVQELKLNKTSYVLTGIQKLLICMASPVFNDNFDALVRNKSAKVIFNLNLINQSVQNIMTEINTLENGEKTGSLKVDDEIVKENLYLVIEIINETPSLKDMPVFKDLVSYFELGFYENQLKNITVKTSLAQQDPELIGQIDKLLLEIKEELVLLTNKQNTEELQNQHYGKFHNLMFKLNDSLPHDLLKLKEFTGNISRSIEQVKNKTFDFSDILQKEISLGIVLLEYGINLLVKATVSSEERVSFEKELELQHQRILLAQNNAVDALNAMKLPERGLKNKAQDEQKAFLKIFAELSKELKNAEDILDQLLRNKEVEKEELINVFKPLNSARGIFAVLGHKELSEVIKEISAVWKSVYENGLTSVEPVLLNHSITWLSGISLYVNSSENNNMTEANEFEERTLQNFNTFFNKNVLETITPVVQKDHSVFEHNEPEEIITPENTEHYVIEEVAQSEETQPTQTEIVAVEKSEESTQNLDIANDSGILEVFIEEAEGVLANQKIIYQSLAHEINQHDKMVQLRRDFHTLKGSGRMVGLENLGEVVWVVEQEFNSMLNLNLPMTPSLLAACEYISAKTEEWIQVLKEKGQVAINAAFEKSEFSRIKAVTASAEEVLEPVETTHEEVSEVHDMTEVEIAPAQTIDVGHEDEFSLDFELDSHAEVQPEVVAHEAVEHEEMTHEPEEVVQELVQPDVIVIDGQEVSLALYQLFNEESNAHLQSLRDFVHSHVEHVRIDTEFMRHAHTLSSIAKTVNLQQFAQLASRIESLSNLALETERLLSKEEMTVLRHAVDNLDMFKDAGKSVEESHYHALLANLDELKHEFKQPQEELHVPKSVEALQEHVELQEELRASQEAAKEETKVLDKASTEELVKDVLASIRENLQTEEKERITAHFEELKENLNQEKSDFNEVVRNSQQALEEEINRSLDQVKQEIQENVTRSVTAALDQAIEKLHESASSVEHAAPQINMEELSNSISAGLERSLTEKCENIIRETLEKQQKADNTKNAENEELQKRIKALEDNLEKKMSAWDKEKETLEKGQQEGFSALKKDIRYLAHLLKKKSNESDQELTGDEVSNEEFDDSFLEDFSEEELAQYDKALLMQDDTEDLFNKYPFIQALFEEKVSTIQDEIDHELYEISRIETQEIMEKVEIILDSVYDNEFVEIQTQELKRQLHTLKGSVRMAGANKIGMIAHRLESILDYAENHQLALNEFKGLIQKELEKVTYLINNINVMLSPQKLAWLDSIVMTQNNSSVVSDTEETKIIEIIPHREEKQYIRVVSDTLDSLINEAGEIRLTRTTLEGMLTSNEKGLGELKASSVKLLKMVKELEIQAETQIAVSTQQNETGKDFDPLELDRFTRLQELTRFMTEAVTDIQDTVGSMSSFFKTQENAVVQQSILTNNILDSLMQIRLVPVDTINERLYKITRNTAKELEKRVSLEVFGEQNEMDRVVLDRIQSPLEHLIRNCIAHGIETPLERESKGKSPIGKVTMETLVDGNFIIMKISDDGAGLNLNKIKEIGLNKGLIQAEQNISRDELIELIFRPNFSTADSISQVSGRGVGMDVVKSEVFALGGSIKTETEEGKGTQFTIILPVSVATNQAMLADISGKLIAIPALLVTEVISLKKEKMENAYARNEVEHRGVTYPLYYLGHMMGLLPVHQKPEMKTHNTLIIASYLNQSIAVHVDKLETTDEILIKPIGPYLAKINGLLGATLLGDGRQGIVVNPVMLKAHFEKNILAAKTRIDSTEPMAEKEELLTVMVVDDSLTVRKATEKVLLKYGYHVILAKDGENALEQLQVMIPNIILSDIEMPVMDGFEFVRNVKNTDKYKNIPVIMITSRTADKHKNYAMTLGVNEFLGKPYQEDQLIESIRKFTRH